MCDAGDVRQPAIKDFKLFVQAFISIRFLTLVRLFTRERQQPNMPAQSTVDNKLRCGCYILLSLIGPTSINT
jgi:hypothetical protein